MPFYKKDEDLLLSGTRIHGPNFTLLESTHEENTYPVGGWYWFDTELEAREALGMPLLLDYVSKDDALKILIEEGVTSEDIIEILNQIEDSTDRKIAIIEWEERTTIKRDHPLVELVRVNKGWTQEFVDELFNRTKALI